MDNDKHNDPDSNIARALAAAAKVIAGAGSNVTAPVKDTNGDGILNGSELLAQLKKENVQGQKRAASERVHGVLETVYARGTNLMMNTIRQNVSKKDWHPEVFASILTTQLLTEINKVSVGLATDKNYLQKREQEIKDKKQTYEAHERELADLHSFADFAKSFSTVFPKGIKIEAKDITEILHHFGGDIALPKPVQKAAGKPHSYTRA